MGGAGYNIPISVSYARTDTTNPVFGANTNFVFGSPYATTGTNDQSARNTDSATATSAAAQGNLQQQATSATAGSQSTSPVSDGGGVAAINIPPEYLYIAGGAFVLLLGVLWLTRK